MSRVHLPKFGPPRRNTVIMTCALAAVCVLWFAAPAIRDGWTQRSLTRRLRDGEIRDREQALHGLHELGETPFSDLIAMLGDSEVGIRVLATDALIWSSPKPQEVIYPLIKALEDKHHEVRWNAAYALGEMGVQSEVTLTEGEQAAVRALCAASTDESEGVRTAAMCALGQFKAKCPASLPTLLDGLKDESSSVQLAAAWALLGIDSQHDTRVIPVIMHGLSASDEKTRETAMHLVKQFGPRIRNAIPNRIKLPTEDDQKLHGRTAAAFDHAGRSVL